MRPRGIAVEDRVDEQSPAVSTENEENSMSQPEVQEKQPDNAIFTAPEEIETGIDLESPQVQLLDLAGKEEMPISVATSDRQELIEMMKQSAPAENDVEPINLQSASPSIGLRSNRDFGVVITIPEYSVEPCRQFAEADSNKPLEQWCSEFFLQALEAYCTPLKGR